MSGTKVQLKVYISRQTDQKLRRFINENFGEFRRGLLSQIVEEAILRFIEEGGHAHTNSDVDRSYKPRDEEAEPPKPPRSISKVLNIVMQIMAYDVITERELKQVIAMVAGHDRRTFKSYIEVLEDVYEIIEKVGVEWRGRKREVIYKVNRNLAEAFINSYGPLEPEKPERLRLVM